MNRLLKVLRAGGQSFLKEVDEVVEDDMVSDWVNETMYVPEVLANKQKMAEAEAADVGVPWYTTVGQVFTDPGTLTQFGAETLFAWSRAKRVAGYGWDFVKESGKFLAREAGCGRNLGSG